MINPSRYRIIAIGKIRKPWIQNGIDLYMKRLPGLFITEIRDSSIRKESETIRSALKNGELLIPLCEEGETFTSLTFSKCLQTIESQRIAFIVGGANGICPSIKDRAHILLSLSTLTFPHEIARLLLMEQLYRATTITRGGPYHRE